MKNIMKFIFASVIVLGFALQVQSQNTTAPVKEQQQKQNKVTSASGNFVDKDNNGICDNFETRSGNGGGANFIDKNGDGICDNIESRSGNRRGVNFVDKNGDGICDNRANIDKTNLNCCRNGQGYKHRNGQRQGKGKGPGKCCRR